MDRTTELKNDYEQMAKLVEKFEKRQQLKIEGEWYLCEATGMPSFITSSKWLSVEVSGHTIEELERGGWTVTPVKIFRESS